MPLLNFFSAVALASCTVTDGDTIRCGDERIRLVGIDAPEMGECARYRRCVEGSGPEAREALRRLIAGKPLTIERVGTDRYDRTLGVVYAGGRNLSCAMIAIRQAKYVERWDDDHRIAKSCPEITTTD